MVGWLARHCTEPVVCLAGVPPIEGAIVSRCEAGTRAGDRERLLIMRHTSMTRAHCDEVLDAFAAAVRAEHGEQIAQRIEAHSPDDWRGDSHATRPMLERNQALRDAYRFAARLAREAQS